MKILKWVKICAYMFVLANVLGCPDYDDISTCNDNLFHLPLDRDISYGVRVLDTNNIPQPGVQIELNFKQYICDGETSTIFSDKIVTNENGIVAGQVFYTWKHDNDFGNLEVGVSQPSGKLIGYTKKFDFTDHELFQTITIADLEG